MSDVQWRIRAHATRWLPVPRPKQRTEDLVSRWIDAVLARTDPRIGLGRKECEALLESAPCTGGVVYFPTVPGVPTMAALAFAGGAETKASAERWADPEGCRHVDVEAFDHPDLTAGTRILRTVRQPNGAVLLRLAVLAWNDEAGVELSLTTADSTLIGSFLTHGEQLVSGISPVDADAGASDV